MLVYFVEVILRVFYRLLTVSAHYACILNAQVIARCRLRECDFGNLACEVRACNSQKNTSHFALRLSLGTTQLNIFRLFS